MDQELYDPVVTLPNSILDINIDEWNITHSMAKRDHPKMFMEPPDAQKKAYKRKCAVIMAK